MKNPSRILTAAMALVAVAFFCGAAHADEHMARVTPPPLVQQECGSCHIPYPAGLLPAASWQHLMANLPKHFGTDASLDAKQAAEVSAWLTSHAATGRRASQAAPDDRITRTAWFQREHDEVSRDVWSRASVKSASNCAACHANAAQGSFNEHDIHIPR
jgi:hypothetical protein